MKLIELHILQSFPVSCLNRDDVGSPKSAIFGGVPRARISSQCLKRAGRNDFKALNSQAGGMRGRFIISPLREALTNNGISNEVAQEWATRAAVALTKSKKAGEKPIEKATIESVLKKLSDPESGQVSTALFLSKLEIDAYAKEIAAEINATNGVKSLLKCAKKALKESLSKDGIDIALYGRMVAADTSLNVESSTMFSHALSTHKVSNDIDFYSAVEEFDKDQEVSQDAGASMIGTLEFTSATYYRYAAINLDLLFDEAHLGQLDSTQKKAVLDAFIRATLMAVPSARKNSMNAATLPFEVLGVLKETGQPVQLVNAFEKPVVANGSGLAEASLGAMKTQLESLKNIWGIEHTEELWLTETGLPTFIAKLTDHVE